MAIICIQVVVYTHSFITEKVGSFYFFIIRPVVPRILSKHRPRAFGQSFGGGLEGVELFVP